nr:MAG TPA: hypothetical protein [Caudoviricetes sp.]
MILLHNFFIKFFIYWKLIIKSYMLYFQKHYY